MVSSTPFAVDELVAGHGGLSGISKSTVSKLCKDIDERVGEFLKPPAHRRMALSLARRHLSEGAPGRTDRTSRRNNRRGRQHQRDAVRSSASVSARPRPRHSGPSSFDPCAFAAWGASDWSSATRISGLKGRHRPGLRSNLATLSRPLDAQRPGPCLAVVSILSSPLPSEQAFDQPDRTHAAKPGARSQSNCARAGQNWPISMDASEHDVLAYMSIPAPASHQTAQHEPN